MPHSQKLSILIVDADLLGREGLKRVLSHEYRNVEFGEVRTAEEGLARIKARPWRLVVLDASLPDNDGFVVLQEIHHPRPEAAVLMRSIHGDSVHGARSLQLGAAGYISKTCGRSDLLKAFRSVLDGKKHFSKSIGREVDPSPALHANLSAQEWKVFLALAAGRRTADISAELNLSAKTVSTYKLRVFNKLDVKSVADLVRYQIDHKLF
jgi:two-component system, NarL family, invasion response regulator UvrY